MRSQACYSCYKKKNQLHLLSTFYDPDFSHVDQDLQEYPQLDNQPHLLKATTIPEMSVPRGQSGDLSLRFPVDSEATW